MAATDTGVLSRRAWIALGAAIVVVVAVVASGIFQQDRRQIPAARSVEIWSALTTATESAPVEFGAVHAQALVAIVNHLGRMPSGEYACGVDTGAHYRLVFETASGAVQVNDELGGCLGVAISSQGSDWGKAKWDPSGRLSGAVRADLAGTDRS